MTVRRRFTANERGELWRRWRMGESLSSIARTLERKPSVVHDLIAATGGLVPSIRRRSPRTLTLEEREEISRRVSLGASIRAIASLLERAPSTISREVTRNGGKMRYRATVADQRAWAQARRPKLCKLARHPRLRRAVAQKLYLKWSPEQIAGWLKNRYPNDPSMTISAETVYRSLFIQARGVLKKELQEKLRAHRGIRRPKAAGKGGYGHGQILDGISIRERPAEAEDRAVPGHWEGDLLSGSENSHIATLVERASRFALLVKVEGKDTVSVVAALTKQIKKLPNELRRSLTWDRGSELTQHKKLSIAANVAVYFCDPHSPWQRGSNENTNGLLRQYFPKGTSLRHLSQAKLNQVARELNGRPRKTLGFKTPAEILQQVLQ